MPKRRPKNLNLLTIRMPVNAVVSIMHRASGVLLFLLLPALLWSLQQSLIDLDSYMAMTHLFHHGLVQLLLVCLAWVFFHHFFAGLRHLMMDMHRMKSLPQARMSGFLVLIAGFVAMLLFANWMR